MAREALLLVTLLPLPAFAQVTITEIMYDLSEGSDAGREWIEVYAGESVDLSKLKLVENGSNHAIKAFSGGTTIAAGQFAVIADNPAKFSTDNPMFTGVLFDSAFTLSNDGESLSIARGDGAIDTVVYTNASGNGTGDTLQRNPGSAQFDVGIPTPGSGIPFSGLVKSTPPQNGKGKQAAAAAATVQAEVMGESDFPPESPLVSRQQTQRENKSALWWLGALLIGGGAAAGASLSRYYRKSEWQIVEESE